jgi:hypothetical protein
MKNIIYKRSPIVENLLLKMFDLRTAFSQINSQAIQRERTIKL